MSASPIKEWPDCGYAPPRDGWPGGIRYGVRTERQLVGHGWSQEARAIAADHQITLPEVRWRVFEWWWDQPVSDRVEVVAEGGEGLHRTFTQRHITARKYGRSWWDDNVDHLLALAREGRLQAKS